MFSAILIFLIIFASSWSNKVDCDDIKCLVSPKKFSNEYLLITDSEIKPLPGIYPSSKINKFSDIEFRIKHVESDESSNNRNDYNYYYDIGPFDEYYLLNDKYLYLCSSNKFQTTWLTHQLVKLNMKQQFRLLEVKNRSNAIDSDECKWRFEKTNDSFTIWNIQKNESLYASSQLIKYNKRNIIRNVYLLPTQIQTKITNTAEQFKWKFDCNIPNF
jgi:hypothetical protein